MQARRVEGTLIHGTLRYEDLMPAFLDLLATLSPEKSEHLRQKAQEVEGVEDLSDRGERESALLDRVMNAIGDHMEDGYYFGSLDGDASDFGVWLIDEDERH